MKRIVSILVTAGLASLAIFRAQGAPPLYDSFAYTAGNLGAVGSAGGWDANSFSVVAVTSGNLTGPTGFPASAGDMIVLSKGTGSNYVTFANNTVTNNAGAGKGPFAP